MIESVEEEKEEGETENEKEEWGNGEDGERRKGEEVQLLIEINQRMASTTQFCQDKDLMERGEGEREEMISKYDLAWPKH